MKCKDCKACRLGFFESKPNSYVCIGVKEPFVVYDTNQECTEYESNKTKTIEPELKTCQFCGGETNMIEVYRQLKSYVESRNNTYSISFNLKEAKELLKYINRLEVRNYKLDKALDKACADLEWFEHMRALEYCTSFNCKECGECKNKEQWKAWCLDD